MAVMIPLYATILPFSVILRRRIKPEGTYGFTRRKIVKALLYLNLLWVSPEVDLRSELRFTKAYKHDTTLSTEAV